MKTKGNACSDDFTLPAHYCLVHTLNRNAGEVVATERRFLACQLRAEIICYLSLHGLQSLINSEILVRWSKVARPVCQYSRNTSTPEFDEKLYLQSKFPYWVLDHKSCHTMVKLFLVLQKGTRGGGSTAQFM
jgi:hypothetical protein